MKLLERRLGLGAVIAISMSAMIGSGIFVLPGLAAHKTGPSVWLAYLLAGLCVLPAALSKSELSTAMPVSGGTYVYIERAFGPLAGTVAGLGLWLSLLFKSSFALVGFAYYLGPIADLPIIPAALVLLLGIVALNVNGIKAVSRVQQVVVTISIGSLLALVVASLGSLAPEHLQNEFSHGADGLLGAAAFVFVSYAGVTKIAAIAEEVRDPGKNLPVGMMVSLGLMAVIYSVVAFVLVGVLDLAQLEGDKHPIYTLADTLGGHGIGAVAAVIGVVTLVSMANAGLLSASRFPFAMSRDALLPRVFANIHASRLTPVPAIIATGVAMAAVIVGLDVEKIAKLASAFMILLFITVNITVIVLRESRAQWYRPAYRSPFYPWLQGFGVLSGVLLLGLMGLAAITASIAMAALGAAVFVAYGRRRAQRRGVFGLMGRRQELLAAPSCDLELADEASVTVPLLGTERSPEMVVEMGAALAYGRPIEAIRVTEVPEQTILGAMLDEGTAEASIRRRLDAMAEERSLDLTFNSIVSRDVARTIHAASTRTHCDWLVMEWHARTQAGYIFKNPFGWLLDNLDCNLALFRDAGVRHIREILVYAEPGPHDALVVTTADHLAEVHGAALTLVRWIADDASAIEVTAAADYLHELGQLCERPTTRQVLRGRRLVPAVAPLTAGFDLLVLGSPRQSSLLTAIRGTEKDRLINQAACSVLSLKTPRTQTHKGFFGKKVAPAEDTAPPASLIDHLTPRLIATRLPEMRKDALFQRIAERFAVHVPGLDARALTDAFWERERTQNTAVGLGIALPHASVPGLAGSHVGVFTMASPMDYQAPDGGRVDVLVVFVGPPSERQLHLELLSHVARLLMSEATLARVRDAATPEEILQAFEESSVAAHLG
ncbi:MAG: amino acid permease [Deltaproteobacteria bacterium]|nr:MAG: amino acid permease [Deltaproteobacteria bacterium]